MRTVKMTKNNGNIIGFKSSHLETREQVLERLFKEHEAAVRSFIRGRIGVDEEPEDIVQEVFLRMAGIDNLEEKMHESRGSNRGYIFAMANNLIVDLERRNVRLRNYAAQQRDSGEGLAQEISPEKLVSARRDLDLVKSVIMGLRPNWRRAFILNRFKFMSYTEIAREMKVTVKQVENYMAQALSRIRKAERAIKADGEQK